MVRQGKNRENTGNLKTQFEWVPSSYDIEDLTISVSQLLIYTACFSDKCHCLTRIQIDLSEVFNFDIDTNIVGFFFNEISVVNIFYTLRYGIQDAQQYIDIILVQITFSL